VQVRQYFFEQDSGPDQAVGSETNYHVLPIGGDHTFTVTRDVPDTEAGREELYQRLSSSLWACPFRRTSPTVRWWPAE
jgi:hypothetical protein